ncbi:ABC transporter permease [Paenibacillus crassostreae]|uniref:ABC transporter permease n=1 Tax=Paenibacillus crassostreae TaxID=1763538 RepID=A0A167DNS9_9BACL|nr:ABC transporter permease [Paenibacillus crassostreae]AOZ91239.1 ABC transporter permease [Paenibacillus crassostreae]OAB74602.1 ABC transporter permease [Paenibacillus crassostreae]
MKLIKKLLRDIKQSIGQFLAFVLVITIGAFFYTGLVTLSDNLSTYTKEYFHTHNLSDLNVYYDQISKQDTSELDEIEGTNKVEGRYTFDATQSFGDTKATLKIHSIPANNIINTPTVIEGNIPSRKDQILLDSHYAREHQYRVGDQIKLSVNDEDVAFTISGLGENVEYAKKNETQDHKTSGFAYVAEAGIPRIAGSLYYNEVLIDAEEGYDIDRLGQNVEAQSYKNSYVSQISKDRTFSYSQLQQTVYNNKLMSKVIPLVLFIIEAIILFLTMSRIIDSQRNQVGIMKALGVKSSSIMLHYMGFPVLVGIIGSIIGCIVSAIIFVPMIETSNARSYSLPSIAFSLSPFSVITPILFSSAFGMLACYLSGIGILREHAAEAMRPKPPKKMKKLLIERLPEIWRRISYSNKLILRNIFLNKQKAIASSVGVVVSTVLLITAFGTQTSLQRVADQIEEVNTYDLKVDYTRGAELEKVELPTGIESSYYQSAFPVEFVKGDDHENATLTVTEKDNALIQFFDENDNPMTLMDSGVLVPKSYADQYKVAIGDTIRIRFTDPSFANKTVDMKVTQISNQYSNPSFFCSIAYLKSFGIDYNPSSILVKASNTADLTSVRQFFEQDNQVDTIADKDDLKESAQFILKQNSFIFIMFIISAVILSFGAIYTISSINIYERNRELATLKVLGYQKNKINRLIFSENMILTTFAVIIALPISGYMYSIIIEALSSTHQQIPDQINMFVMLVSIIIAFLLTTLSNLMLRRKVSRINMIESLKSIE